MKQIMRTYNDQNENIFLTIVLCKLESQSNGLVTESKVFPPRKVRWRENLFFHLFSPSLLCRLHSYLAALLYGNKYIFKKNEGQF